MPSTTYKFMLDDAVHTVEIAYSRLSAWERITVDERVLFEGFRWTMSSHYPFTIGSHECVASLHAGLLNHECKLTVDGEPFELLPERSYLRAAAPPQSEPADELLRAANDSGVTPPDELLRPSQKNDGTP